MTHLFHPQIFIFFLFSLNFLLLSCFCVLTYSPSGWFTRILHFSACLKATLVWLHHKNLFNCCSYAVFNLLEEKTDNKQVSQLRIISLMLLLSYLRVTRLFVSGVLGEAPDLRWDRHLSFQLEAHRAGSHPPGVQGVGFIITIRPCGT